MKNLGQFFDAKRFFEGKKVVITDNQPYVDFETKKPLGRTLELGIVEDKTSYIPSKSGNVASNAYEKFKIKVLDDGVGYADHVAAIPNGTEILIPEFTKATLWVNTRGKNPVLDMSLECKKIDVVRNDPKKDK